MTKKFYFYRKLYMCLIVVYAIIREIVPLNYFISSSYVSAFVFLLGGILIVWDFFCNRDILNSKNIYILGAFTAVYGISTIINRQYGYVDNIKTIAILVLMFFTLYPFGNKRSKEEILNDIKCVSITYVITMSVFVILSIIMYFFDVTYLVSSYGALSQGFSSEYGRLWGVFTECNCGAVYALSAMFISVWLYTIASKKIYKVLLVLSALIDFVYMVLAISKTAQLVLVICAFWIALCIVWFKFSSKKRIIAVAVIPLLVSAITFGSIKASEWVLPRVKYLNQKTTAYNSVDWDVHHFYDVLYTRIGKVTVDYGLSPETRPAKSDKKSNKKIHKLIELERTDEKGDASNGRIERWKDGLEIFETAPVFGVTARNVGAYADDKCPWTLMSTMDLSVHNSYLEVLVSTGAVGTIVFLVFFVLSVILVVKVVFSKYSFSNIMLSAAMMIVAMAGFFHTDLFFIFRVGGVLLWIILGYFAYQSKDIGGKVEE